MRDAIKAAMVADPTLAGLLTGGIYAGGRINRQDTSGAFDSNGELLPCALVREENTTGWGGVETNGGVSARTYVLITFYQQRGHDVIDQALDQAREVLHGSKLSGTVFRVEWSGDRRDRDDPGLECAMGQSRYTITRWR